MSGFWSEALLSVQAKLDAKTESAKERLSSLKETVAATVESAQERIAADIESLKEEHARFIAEQDGDGGSGDEASGGAYTGQNDALPWDVPAKGSDIKALVLGLSRDEATFTRPPPAEATYAFPFARRTALILELLELDPALKKAHTKLAHKAKEETFFTNYFYRVAERALERGRRARASKFRAPSESSATDSAVLINASEAASEFSSSSTSGELVADDDAADAAVLAEIENVEVGDDDDDDLERQIAAELDGARERGAVPRRNATCARALPWLRAREKPVSPGGAMRPSSLVPGG
ncbi:synapse-associated protein [Aureococcus anophagefferens]|uniref:Synapse-associated protein n=1 Tax=Aureococcus anophagefferens TaxID=44056 RepID=A0ABR1FVX4_AURAN